jgi:hypothetical protein
MWLRGSTAYWAAAAFNIHLNKVTLKTGISPTRRVAPAERVAGIT